MIAYLVLGICLVVGLGLMARWFVATDPRQLARLLRYGAISLVVVVVLALALTRNIGPALGVLVLLLPFLRGWRDLRRRMKTAQARPRGKSSRLRTAMLDVELDHDTGRMSGTVTAGRFAGQSLGGLSEDDLKALLRECRQDDPQSVPVIEAFLDREFGPEWRSEEGQPGSGDSKAAAASGAMTAEEAYALLGLAQGATKEEIKAAHHRLMMKVHPDQGGSDYIAAKLNQAKDLLLGK